MIDAVTQSAVMEAIMRGSVLVVAAGIALSASAANPAKAQDAEFGCKVLLCAAASNPSWPSIPYCVPVMNQLYAMMRSLRFRWPVCTAAGTGLPGHKPYQPCPAGWQEARRSGEGGDHGLSTVGLQGGNEFCARRLSPQTSGRPLEASVPGGQIQCPDQSGNVGGVKARGQDCIEYVPRTLNERPYYFDVRNADGNQTRVWFNVR
jgi:hypothetical protein